MMAIYLIAYWLLIGVLVRYECTRMHHHGEGRRELLAFTLLMLLALALGTGMILQLPIPNPTKAIEAIFKPLGERIIPPA